jgi:hypothetical protein
MNRFRKKPLVVEAMCFCGFDSQGCLGQSLARFLEDATFAKKEGKLFVLTLEGDMEVGVGDWIIKGVKGEFYPCKNDIFLQTYEIE